MGLIGAVRALLSILTAIPVKAAVNDVYSLSRMVWLFPVAGAVHGVVVAMLLAARQAIGDLTAAVAAATAAHAMNRFMHADGLADFCDGLLTLGTKEDRLRAMRDARIGAGGVAAFLLATLLVIAAYHDLPVSALAAAYVAEVMGRVSMVACAAMGRPAPNGMGSLFVGAARARSYAASVAVALALWLPLPLAWGRIEEHAALFVLTLAASTSAGVVVSLASARAFGCVTGDCLGAANELGRVASLLAGLSLYRLGGASP